MTPVCDFKNYFQQPFRFYNVHKHLFYYFIYYANNSNTARAHAINYIIIGGNVEQSSLSGYKYDVKRIRVKWVFKTLQLNVGMFVKM